jgi:hypothetical protein
LAHVAVDTLALDEFHAINIQPGQLPKLCEAAGLEPGPLLHRDLVIGEGDIEVVQHHTDGLSSAEDAEVVESNRHLQPTKVSLKLL